MNTKSERRERFNEIIDVTIILNQNNCFDVAKMMNEINKFFDNFENVTNLNIEVFEIVNKIDNKSFDEKIVKIIVEIVEIFNKIVEILFSFY